MSIKDLNVLLCFNAPVSLYENYSGKPRTHDEIDDMSETAFEEGLDTILQALNESFASVDTAAISKDVYNTINIIKDKRPDVIVNLVESVEGVAEYEAYHAGLYELLRIPYTGNIPSCLGNCLNKLRAKHILAEHGIPVPAAIKWNGADALDEKKFGLRFPVITKLLTEDASIGISENSVVNSFGELMKQGAFLHSHYNKTILVEEYLDGREFNVAILGNRALPISEISFSGLPDGLPKIVTYEGKWVEQSIYYKHTVPIVPAPLTDKLRKEIELTALNAFHAMHCRDYARVDIRLGADEKPYVIEVNPNPDISPDAGFARAANIAGLSYAQLLKEIVELACARN